MALKDKAKKLNGEVLPLMEGRDKLDEIPMNSPVTVDDFGFLTGEKGNEYVVLTFKEYPKHFFFGGSVVTDKFAKLMPEMDEADFAEIRANGIPVAFSKRKSKDKTKQAYTTCEFYPEF